MAKILRSRFPSFVMACGEVTDLGNRGFGGLIGIIPEGTL